MADLREALAASLDAIETATPSAPAAEVPQDPPEVAVAEPSAEQRARDELGRFAAKAEDKPAEVAPVIEPPQPVINRPSTWKKEYWPLYDKLATGQALNADEAKKLADYTNQRENEFKSGVSTYKAEAEAAKEIQTAIAPFMPELQRYNIAPGQWIASLGRAHQTLQSGSPQDKLAMFQRLAQEYGVPLSSIAEGAQAPQVDPQLQWVTQELTGIKSAWTKFQEQQETQAQQAMQDQIKSFASAPGHEHFEAVKDHMARLLSSGMAQDLQTAYDKAVRLNDEVWTSVQQQRATQTTQQAAAAVAKAKAAAVSPKSASPSAPGDQKPKGLRAQLEAGVDAALGGGRV
jgi:hypothetical protein